MSHGKILMLPNLERARALFNLTQGAWALHPRQQHLCAWGQGASHCTWPLWTTSTQEFGDPWKCTTPPCLPDFLTNKRASRERRHTGPCEKPIEDPTWGTLRQPAVLSTRLPSCRQAIDNQCTKLSSGEIWAPANAQFTDDMSFLGSFIWKECCYKAEVGSMATATCLESGNKRLLLLAPARPRRSRHRGPCFASSFKLALLSQAGRLCPSISSADLHMTSKKKLLVCSAVVPQVPKALWLPWIKIK